VQQAYMDFWCTCINTCASKVNNLVGWRLSRVYKMHSRLMLSFVG
jgi:hypothetical protein